MAAVMGSESSGRRRSFIEGLLQKSENDDRNHDEPLDKELYSLPNGVYSIEAMRFPNLYLGKFQNSSHAFLPSKWKLRLKSAVNKVLLY